MLNNLDVLLPKWRAGETVAMTTVIGTRDSAPLPVGSSQMTTADGQVFGSVSGGCVESAVYEANMACLLGSGPKTQEFGFSDHDAWEIGLTCGGTLETFTELLDRESLPWLEELAEAAVEGVPAAVVTVVASDAPDVLPGTKVFVRGGSVAGSFGTPSVDAWAVEEARRAISERRHALLTGSVAGAEVRAFVQVFSGKPRLIIFGAVDFAAALARAGAFVGYRVTVCDARPVFLTDERFPDAHELVHRQPHEYLAAESAAGRLDARSALCVLTHDVKFDVPVLSVALRLPWGNYVGAMGSRRTHRDRNERLRADGLGSSEIARLHSPLGLDVGAVTPEETAISIMAEIIAFGSGRSGASLSMAEGPIHGAALVTA
ncbi:XdhC family protein [Paenarthrobacter ureafaciens]|jgi:xanthine dehydrogenase accessory factor|uniref:XdhC family protein n=1 Tax=Paenarthrobacter ureafaciens TaxID=37931 RepID=UPI001ACAFE99|nr:XdhC/CoxI family protein [Paenarthrobacter ureafaciens]MBN9128828.1 XdhC family protein [Paenarthrobacter ureafaciens]UOD81757.1 XdhC family protein [Paenarthrobacter ureafaciens]WNZ05248.1 XdhC family protein [Paenarthrobacter ureafaciens]